jgi:hypothetical protein
VEKVASDYVPPATDERDPVIEAYKEHVDRTLLRENLRRPVQLRLENWMRQQRFAAELREAGKKAFG